MTIHRFFVKEESFKNNRVFIPADISKQITKVLRLRKSDHIIVLNGMGDEFEVELDQMISDTVSGKIIKQHQNTNEPRVFICLYQALTPKDKFETVLQKGTEIGISKFVPVETKRSLVKLNDLKPEKVERFQRIIQEAAEQSERGIVPELERPLKFEDAIITALNKGLVLIAWEEENVNGLKHLNQSLANTTDVSIFIGPEGGFEEKEVEFAKSRGAKTISLGPRILRTETAGLVMAANILFVKDM